VLLRLLFLGEDVKEAVDARRLHHQDHDCCSTGAPPSPVPRGGREGGC